MINEPRTFADAIEDLRKGQRMTKLEWDDPNVFITFEADRLCIFGADDDKLLHPLIISSDILFATDFVVVHQAPGTSPSSPVSTN